jgi:hypothetical protein
VAQKGRPNKIAQECRIAAKDYGPQAFKVLVRIMNDEKTPASARCTTALGLLDRAYGKAHQPIDMDLKIDPESLSDADLARFLIGGSAAIYGSVADEDRDLN